MTSAPITEGLLRELAPQVLGSVLGRYGDFTGAEDAVQEALLAAAAKWPTDGRPDNPLAWLMRVAARSMADQYRRDDARRRREDLAAAAARTTNLREQHYLTTEAARLATGAAGD